MLAGFPPFCDDDALGTYNRILRGALTFPPHFSPHARDLVRRLLQADLSKRCGVLAGGAVDVKQHAWFRPVDFGALKAWRVEAPIRCVAGTLPWGCLSKHFTARGGTLFRIPLPALSPHRHCRPKVRAPDDTSNFEDYSDLPALAADGSKLTEAEQALFSGF